MGMSAGGDGDLNSEINVTPLVDVMLVLLIIFMITAPMMNTGVDIDLPKVTANEKIEDSKGKLILSIDKNYAVFVSSKPTTWAELEKMLSSNLKLQAEKALYVEADGNIPYAVVVTAMAVARRAGIEKVMMLTTPNASLPLADLDKKAQP